METGLESKSIVSVKEIIFTCRNNNFCYQRDEDSPLQSTSGQYQGGN